MSEKTTRRPKRGDEFVHQSILEPTWTPCPGQKYGDTPKARVRVTSVQGAQVWFTYAWSPPDHPGVITLPLTDFLERYGDQLS